ncbi:hypothetical protein D3C81_1434270 [compost metagenome]
MTWSIGAPLASAGCIQASDCNTFDTMFRCSSVAPFEIPVVPPVYCRKAMSSGPVSTGFSVMLAPSASTSLKRTQCGSSHAGTIFLTLRTTKLTTAPFTVPSMSPMLATTTCFTGVAGSTAWSVAAKFSRMTMASAPLSFNWCSSSRGV